MQADTIDLILETGTFRFCRPEMVTIKEEQIVFRHYGNKNPLRKVIYNTLKNKTLKCIVVDGNDKLPGYQVSNVEMDYGVMVFTLDKIM